MDTEQVYPNYLDVEPAHDVGNKHTTKWYVPNIHLGTLAAFLIQPNAL
jgi:hypothetical protein